MPNVILTNLPVFNKKKQAWYDFSRENVLQQLRALKLYNAVFTDTLPTHPGPPLSNSLGDQRDNLIRIDKYEENCLKLEEDLLVAYAVTDKMVRSPETAPVLSAAEASVAQDNWWHKRLVIRAILQAMDHKYSNQLIADNAPLVNKWNRFRWTYRYGFRPETAADPTDYRYTSIDDFRADWNTAVLEYSHFDPATTQNELGMKQTLLLKLQEYPGLEEAIKIAAQPLSSCDLILTTLVNQEAFGLYQTQPKIVNAIVKKETYAEKANNYPRENRVKPKCFNCDLDGHLAMECKKKYCKGCKQNLQKWYKHHIAEGDCVPAKRRRVNMAMTTQPTEPEPLPVDDSEEEDTNDSFSSGNFFNQSEIYCVLNNNSAPLDQVGVAVVKRRVASAKLSGDQFLLDSGAEISIRNGKDNNLDPIPVRRDRIVIEGINGKSSSDMYVDIGSFSFLCMPDASESIISVVDVVRLGHSVSFSPTGVKVQNMDGEVLLEKRYTDGLAYLSSTELKVLRARRELSHAVKNLIMRLHLRQGHAAAETMCRAIETGSWTDTGLTPSEIRAAFRYDPCVDCAIAKIRRGNIGSGDGVTPRIGSTISLDWIPCSVISADGHTGFFYLVDVGTGGIFAYPSKNKTGKTAYKRILLRHLLMMTRSGHIVTTIQSDMGTTETSQETRDVLSQLGIKAEECNIRRQENNVIESYVRVAARGVATIFMSLPWLPTTLWNLALVHFCDVHNTLPNTKSGDKSPAWILEGRVISFDHHFKYPFGTIVAAVYDKNSRFGPRGTFENGLVGFVAGYDHDKINDDGVVVYLPSYKAQETFKQADVQPLFGDEKTLLTRLNISSTHGRPTVVPIPVGTQRSFDLSQIQRTADRERDILRHREALLQQIRDTLPEDMDGQTVTVATLRKVSPLPIQDAVVLKGKKRKAANTDSPSIRLIMSKLDLYNEWKEALSSELTGLAKDSLEYVEKASIPPTADIYDSMMLTTTKRSKKDGTIERRKCRLVVRGDQQVKLLIANIFAPTVSRQSFLLLLILVVQFQLVLKGFDVTQAFLNSDLENLDGEVFIRLPAALFTQNNPLNIPSCFARLKSAVYGLKEAPRLWYDNIDGTLQSFGFRRLVSDICVYVRGNIAENTFVMITLTVDDGAVAASTNALANEVLDILEKVYQITRQDELVSYAGFSIDRSAPDSATVSQPAFIESLSTYITDDYLDVFKSMRTYASPMEENIFDDDFSSHRQPTDTEYKALLGAILYCLPTQPGITFATNLLASRAVTHSANDYVRLIRIVKHLQVDSDRGITFRRSDKFNLNCFCDSSWLLDAEKSISYYCYVIRLGENTLAMTSHKIKGIMLSSTDAEQYSVFELSKQVLYWRDYLKELDLEQDRPTPIYQDNQSAITICRSVDKNFKKVKYFLLRINHVSELIADDIIELIWIQTSFQLADIGTKPLGPAQYQYIDEILRGAQHFFLSNPDNQERPSL